MESSWNSPRNDGGNAVKGVRPITVDEFQRREVSVLVAGLPRAGKSTALNNIFGLTLEARASPLSVTKYVSITRIVQNGVIINVIDTPGLGALDIPREKVLSEIRSMVKITNEFILLYCISVAPNSTMTETDGTIIKNLQGIFGKWVWNRCILLLTFSDTAREKEFSTDKHTFEYIAYLRGHVDLFTDTLKKSGAEIPGAMLLFDYQGSDYPDSVSKKLVAVPAAKEKYCDDVDILPGVWFDKEEYDWTDYAFVEILKKADELERDVLLCFKYNIVSTLKVAAGGATVGAVVGGGVRAIAAAGAEAASGIGVLATIKSALLVGGVTAGSAAAALAGTALAIGIPVSLAWLAIHTLKKKKRSH